MNPHAAHSISPAQILRTIVMNRGLLFGLIKRDVVGRYRGSLMGLLWSFSNPVLMLTIYTFFFSVVFKARWVGGTNSKVEFALVLFTGLLIFNFFSEVINRAPNLILSNANYVKKIIFPLEILPMVALGAGLFHLTISVLVWLIFYILFFSIPSIAALQLVFILIPLILLLIGLTWILSSLGVYLRDVGQIIGMVTMALMFLSPVFYPVESLPVAYQDIMHLNPLTYIVEETRNVMIWGKQLNWHRWTFWTTLSGMIAWVGFAWFQKTRKGFADVI